MAGLLYADRIRINDAISVMIPMVGDILDHDEEYFSAVYSLVATPYDMMLPLDSIGIDFTKIDSFDIFCLMFNNLKTLDLSLIFGDLSLENFQFAKNEKTGEAILLDPTTGVAIDRAVHSKIAATLRKLLNLPNNNKKAGNEEARQYLLERARVKARRAASKSKRPSPLESYIISLVNTAEFKYNYSTVRDISIYQFYKSLLQIDKKIRYDKTMIGYFAGTVKMDDLKPEDKTWILTEN